MDSRQPVLPVGTPSIPPVPNKFEKPLWLYTERVVRVAGYALGLLAAAFAARALYLVYSGVSVLTPATAVSVVLSAVCYVAFRFLRVHADGVAAARKAALDYIEQNPKACLGIKDYLTRHPGLTYPEVAARVANYEAGTQPFTKFCDRNGVGAIAYVTGEGLPRLFEGFLNSLAECYIKPGFSQYEAALPHFMRPHLREEFRRRRDEHLSWASKDAKGRFFQALSDTRILQIDFGGALAAARDPGERLGVSRNEILSCVAAKEFDVYTLGAFVKRNGPEAFKYLSIYDSRFFFDKLEEFVEIEREENSGIPIEHFDSYINAICAARPDLRVGLGECVRKKFAQPPLIKPASAPPAATVHSLADDADPFLQAKRAYLARLTDPNFSLSRGSYFHVVAKLEYPELNLSMDDTAPPVVNRELMQRPFEEFLARNGVFLIHYVRNGALLREKFLTFVEEECRKQPCALVDFRDLIDLICTTPKGQPRPDMDRQKLEQEVERIIFDKFEEFVNIELARDPNINAAHFNDLINAICADRPDHLRTELGRRLQNKFSQPPPARSASAMAAAAASAASSSSSPSPSSALAPAGP